MAKLVGSTEVPKYSCPRSSPACFTISAHHQAGTFVTKDKVPQYTVITECLQLTSGHALDARSVSSEKFMTGGAITASVEVLLPWKSYGPPVIYNNPWIFHSPPFYLFSISLTATTLYQGVFSDWCLSFINRFLLAWTIGGTCMTVPLDGTSCPAARCMNLCPCQEHLRCF